MPINTLPTTSALSQSLLLLDQHFSEPLNEGMLWQQQGHYRYQCDGQLLDIQEPWRIGWDPLNPDYQIIQSLRYSRAQRLLFMVEQHRKKGGQISHTSLSWKHGDQALCQADYQLEKGHWYLYHQCLHQVHELNRPIHSAFAFYPALRVFTGEMLAACENEDTLVLTPDIRADSAEQNKLKASFDLRRSQQVQSQPHQQQYQLSGGPYQQGNALFSVGADGLLTQYQFQQGKQLWQVSLEQLSLKKPITATIIPLQQGGHYDHYHRAV